MRLTDKCWVLASHYGVRERTVGDATRGDSTIDEFYVTEREAWIAESERCAREHERYARDAAIWDRRRREAIDKAARMAP